MSRVRQRGLYLSASETPLEKRKAETLLEEALAKAPVVERLAVRSTGLGGNTVGVTPRLT